MSAQRPAPGQLDAEPVVARQRRAAGRDDVADPGQTGERQRVRPGGDPEPGHLGQAAGHQAGLAVVAEAELLGGAGGDREDVLERAAQLDADEVAVDVEPEPAAAEPSLDPLGERLVVGRHDRRGRQAAGDLEGEVRSGQRGDPGRVEPAGLGDDLAHPQERAAPRGP